MQPAEKILIDLLSSQLLTDTRPRPKHPHLKKYFEKTSLGILQLSKQYEFVTFIDCQSLFYSQGQISNNYFKKDLVNLNIASSKMLAQHWPYQLANK